MIKVYFSWWYGQGWQNQTIKIKNLLIKIIDFFSLVMLLKTLFSPFHQISALEEGRSLQEKLNAWAMRLFSRFFGFFLRTITILIGSITLFLCVLFAIGWLIIWCFLPWSPLLAIIFLVLDSGGVL